VIVFELIPCSDLKTPSRKAQNQFRTCSSGSQYWADQTKLASTSHIAVLDEDKKKCYSNRTKTKRLKAQSPWRTHPMTEDSAQRLFQWSEAKAQPDE